MTRRSTHPERALPGTRGGARRAAVLGLAAAALALAEPARAQQASVRVERRGPASVEADAGGTATVLFRVTLHGASRASVALRPALPEGWALVTDAAPLELASGEPATRIVSAAVPRATPAGTYTLRLTARAPGGGEAQDSAVVRVRPRRELAVDAEETPRFAAAGSAYTVRFLVRNRGNVAEHVRLATVSSHSLEARADAGALDIPPGDARPVSVTVRTRPGTPTAFAHRLELRARPDGDSAALARGRALVQVLPSGSGGTAPPAHHLPVEVRLRTTSTGGGGATPSVSGGGLVRPGGSTRVDFVLRGAEARPTPFSEGEEYRVAVEGRRFGVRAGDGIWTLSPLTEPGRAGRGAGGRISAGPLSLAGFAARERGAGLPDREHGASLALAGGRGAEVAVSWLERQGRDTGQVASLRGAWEPLRGTRMAAEYGTELGGSADALALSLAGSYSRLSYSLREERSDDAYPGPRGGTALREGYLSVRAAGPLRLDASGHRRRGPAPFDTTLAGTLRQESRGARAAVRWGGLASAELRLDGRAGERPDGTEYDRESRSVRVSGTVGAGGAWLSPNAEAGTTRDAVAGREEPFRRLGVNAGVRAGSVSASASVQHTRGLAPESDGARESLAGAVQLSAEVDRATRVRLSGYATSDRLIPGAETRTLDVEVERELLFGHRIVARARSTATGGRRLGEPVLVLDYVAPVGLPMARDRGVGRVSGKVVDAATGAGMAGVAVRLGDRTVLSDGRGTWTFEGVAPGMHPLEVDRLGAGLDRVPQAPMPLSVAVRGGRTERVEVEMVRSGAVEGTVRKMAFAPAAAAGTAAPLVADGGMRDLVVRLSRPDGETLRRVTDAEGRFAFTDLRPGAWTLEVEDAQLPSFHRLEPGSLALELAAGEHRAADLRVVPVRRPVVMVAGGEVRLNAPSSTPPAARTAAAPPRPALAPVPVPARVATAPRRARPVAEAYDEYLGIYVVAEGDASLEAIAYLAYADGGLWPRLWLANRDVLADPNQLPPGLVLRIPAPGPLTPAEVAAERELRMHRR